MIRCSSMHCNVQPMPRKQFPVHWTIVQVMIATNPQCFSHHWVLYCIACIVWTEHFSALVRCSYHDSQPSTIAFQRIGLVLLCIDKWSYLTNKAKNAPQCNPQMHTVQEVIFVLIESQNVMFIGWLWRPLLSHNHPITASYFQDSLRWCCTVLIFTLCY